MKDFKNRKTSELLSTSDPMERRQMVECLDPNVQENLETLLVAIQDSNKGVRDASSQRLMLAPSEENAEKLVPLLAKDPIEIRNLASELLISYGSVAVAPLLAQLSSDDGDVRKFAVDILGLIKYDGALNGLLSALDDEEPNVVVSAAEALGNIGAIQAIPTLISHFKSVEGMEFVVIDALGKLRTRESTDFLVKVAISDELMEAQVALNALQNVDDLSVADNLYKQLDYLDPILRDEAVTSILRIYLNAEQRFPSYFDIQKYADETCEFLKETDSEYKSLIVQLIPAEFVSSHVLFLIGLNTEQDEELDHVVTSRLAEIDTTVFNQHVMENFEIADLSGQLNLALILAQKDMQAAIPFLEKLVQRPEPEVKESILQVISAVSHPAAMPIIKQLLQVNDEAIQENAYYALMNFREKENQGLFEKGLQSSSIVIKELCGEALSQIAPDRLSEIVAANLASSNNDNIIFALDIVTRFPNFGSFQVLVDHLDNESPHVRVAALHALSNYPYAESFDAVEFLLNDIDDDVRRAAFEALLKIDAEQAERPVRAALSDENFWLQTAGIEAIAERQMTDFKDELLDLTSSSNKMVQMKAIEALLEIFDENIEGEITARLKNLGGDGISLLTSAKEQRNAHWL